MPKKQTPKQTVSVKARMRTHAKLAFVPHKHNDYRPHAIRRYGIALILVGVLLAQGVYNNILSGNVLGMQAQITTKGLLDATNKARQKEGKEALVINPALMHAAELKVNNMFAEQYWAHNSPRGETPWYWFGQVGYNYAEAGENLAKNFTSSQNTIRAWLDSPTHRGNVLKSEYRDVGFAVKDGELDGHPTTFVVALYGAPAEEKVQGATAAVTSSPTTDQPISFMGRIGLGLQSLTPVAIGSLVVVLFAINIAMAAHVYRRNLPIGLRRSWYRHHGMYKAIGFAAFAVIVIVAYGSAGQI